MTTRRHVKPTVGLLLAMSLLAAAVWATGTLAAQSRAPSAPATKHAVVRGAVGTDLTYVGDLRRTTATRWCGTLEVSVRRPGSGTPPVQDIYGSGRECGTISKQSVVMVALACPRAVGVAAVLRGRPRLRAKLANGSTRSVPLRRIRDRRSGTFYSVALTASQLPAKIQIVGGAVVADVPKPSEVC